jgi:hypothetical protein
VLGRQLFKEQEETRGRERREGEGRRGTIKKVYC